MIARTILEDVFEDAVVRHRAALPQAIATGLGASGHANRERFGLAIGKAAFAMARGLGAVRRGFAISPHDDGAPLPLGWRRMVSSHPVVDDRALVAADAALELVAGAPADAVVIALISGGASALVELPLVPLPELIRITSSLARLGVPIKELNEVRAALSTIKGGQLALHSVAPVVTLAISDVIGDRLETIGSGPTVGPWLDAPANPFVFDAVRGSVRGAAIALLRRHEITLPRALAERVPSRPVERPADFARVVVQMNRFARRVASLLPAASGRPAPLERDPLCASVESAANQLARETSGTKVYWGEPTLVVPPHHGEGGRMQQLALELAKRLAGARRSALAIGTDGIDGPPPRDRPAPAGAFVDGTTWEAIRAAGIDPQAALERCDAGTALAAVGALVITGPTGVNHADLVVVG